MRLLALDQATIKTGYALFEDSQLKHHGVLNLEKLANSIEHNTAMRLVQMAMEIDKLIHAHKPDAIVIEDVAMLRDAHALIMLARIQGAVILSWALAQINDIPITIRAPSTWRTILGFEKGKRPALKRQAKEYVLQHFQIKATEDEADAICIGVSYIMNQTWELEAAQEKAARKARAKAKTKAAGQKQASDQPGDTKDTAPKKRATKLKGDTING